MTRKVQSSVGVTLISCLFICFEKVLANYYEEKLNDFKISSVPSDEEVGSLEYFIQSESMRI